MSQPTPSDAKHADKGQTDVDHDLIAMADGDRFSNADLYTQIEKSQKQIPWWLWVMVAVVMVLAVALNAPFLKGNEGNALNALSNPDGSFLDMGMVAALLYVGGGFAALFWYTWMRKRS